MTQGGTQARMPRRPAMLEPAQAEQIIGDTDPAAASELAHASAWVVMGLTDDTYPTDAPTRVRDLIAREGVDAVADLWSRSPEFTLPGALWRIFLLHEWLIREGDVVETRYRQGLAVASHSDPQVAGNEVRFSAAELTPTAVGHSIAHLFAGEHSEDTMDEVFRGAATLMRILAVGDAASDTWIDDPSDPLAYPVTTRAHALVRTAAELERAADYAQAGELD